MPRTEQFDLNKIEHLAATLPTYSEICRRLDKRPGYIQYRSGVDPDFKAAIERGRAQFVKNGDSEHGATNRADAAILKPKTDRDGFETGRYKESPHRQTILDSLEVKKYQSARHLCQNTGLSIDDVLSIVDNEADKDIGLKFTGGVMVYFLRVNEPKGVLYNTGDNSFAVKEVEEKPEVKKRVPPKRESKISAEMVEQCAFDGLDLEETALKLGITKNTARIYLQTTAKPHLNEAWKRGKERRREMIASLRKDNDFATQAFAKFEDKTDYASIPATDAEDEAFKEIEMKIELNGKPADALGDILELDDEDFDAVEKAIDNLVAQNGGHQIPAEIVENLEIPLNVLNDPSDEIDRIFDEQLETNPRFEHTLEHISTNGRSREPLEKVKAKLLETKPLPEVVRAARAFDVSSRPVEALNYEISFSNQIDEPANYRVVELSNGKKIFMSEEINIFALKPREAKFCAAIVELIDEFESVEK